MLSERELRSLATLEDQLRRDRRLRATFDAYARYGTTMPGRPRLSAGVRVVRWFAAAVVSAVLLAIGVGSVVGPGGLSLVCSIGLLLAGPLLVFAALLVCPDSG